MLERAKPAGPQQPVFALGLCYKKLAKHLGVNPSTIRNILKGKKWRAFSESLGKTFAS